MFGRIPCKVLQVEVLESFEKVFHEFGLENVLPDVDTVAEGLAVYNNFTGYKEKAALFKVRAMRFTLLSSADEGDQPDVQGQTEWNFEQQAWLDRIQEDLNRTAAVFASTSEKDTDSAREDAWMHNKIRALEGPPGSGKTTVAKHAVDMALNMGMKVLWTTYTAQLAGRMRQVFKDKKIDVDTCHAALGFDEEIIYVSNALAPYGLVIVDEFQQLNSEHLYHICKLRGAIDNVTTFAILGDRYQMPGFGEARLWDHRLWKNCVQLTNLHQMFRCKDPAFKKILGCLRTSKPLQRESGKGAVSVENIMRHRRAWYGDKPKVADVRRILQNHPDTTLLTVSRRGVKLLDDLCIEAKFRAKKAFATVKADIESNPVNYMAGGIRKEPQDLVCTELPLYKGMLVYFTRNVDKTRDFVNGMRATILDYNSSVDSIQAATLAMAIATQCLPDNNHIPFRILRKFAPCRASAFASLPCARD